MAAAIAAAMAAAAYIVAAFRNGFAFDDFRFIVENEHVTGRAPWTAFLTDPHTVDPDSPASIFRPLRTLEFALDHALFGLEPIGFHLHGLAWHALAAALAFLLLRHLLAGPGADGPARRHEFSGRLQGVTIPALLGALFWALHPAQAESVAWISSRGDVAMGACTLASMLCALRTRGADRWLAASLAAGALAMLYKETAVVLPLLVFVLRLRFPLREARRSVGRAAYHASPWLALALVYLACRHAVMAGDYAQVTGYTMGGSAAGTFATMFRGFGYYLASIVVPTRQALDWYLPASTTPTDPAALGWLAVHLALIGAAIRWRAQRPAWSVAIALFYVPLLPVANWPVPLGIPTAERFLYLPLLGPALAVGLVVRGIPRTRAPVWIAVACLLALSMIRASIWNDEHLWSSQLATHETPRGHGVIANRRFGTARDMLNELSPGTDATEREETLRRSRLLLTEALEHADQSIAQWVRIEGRPHPIRDDLLELENNQATTCMMLDDAGHGLVHAQRAATIEVGLGRVADEARGKPDFNRALALRALERGPRALRAMQRACARGGAQPSADLQAFFLAVAEQCAAEGFHDLAREGCDEVLRIDVPGDARQAAQARLDEHEAQRRQSLLQYRELRAQPDAASASVAQLAVSLAVFGERDAADALLGRLERGQALPPNVRFLWTWVRHEALATPAGWSAARERYSALGDALPEARYRRGRCEEALRDDAAAIASYAAALAAAPRDATWRADAAASLERLRRGCPALD